MKRGDFGACPPLGIRQRRVWSRLASASADELTDSTSDAAWAPRLPLHQFRTLRHRCLNPISSPSTADQSASSSVDQSASTADQSSSSTAN